MWHLKYSYKGRDGTRVATHVLLGAGDEYTLGRTPKNSFQIDKPSISALHLRFTIDATDFPLCAPSLKLKVLGQSAIIDEDVINLSDLTKEQREKAEFKTFTKNVVVKISGVTLKFYNKLMLLKISQDMALEYQTGLARVGIPFSTTYLTETTHLVKAQADHSLDILASLLSQVPIIKPDFVKSFVENTDLLKNDYDANVPKVEDFLLLPFYAPNPTRIDLIRNLAFILFDQNQFNYLTPILKIGNAQSHMFPLKDYTGFSDIVKFVEQYAKAPGITTVLVQPEIADETLPESKITIALLNEAAKALGLYLITNEEIFLAVLHVNIDSLIRNRPAKLPSTTSLDHLQPLKKKRRTKIKALDSLDLFAGGGGKIEEESIEVGSIGEIDESDAKGSQLKSPCIPSKKRRKRIEPLDIDSLNVSNISPPLPVGNSVSSKVTDIQPQVPFTQTQDDPVETESKPTVSSTEKLNNSEGSLETTEQAIELLKPPREQQSFLQAAHTTKMQANIRIQNELGDTETIDGDTIDSLRDLAIVESVKLTLRKPINKETVGATTIQNQMRCHYWDPKWTGRKNFKTFVKNDKRSTNGVANTSFLQTHIRNYVPLEAVTLDKIKKKRGPDDELLESNELHNQRQQQLEYQLEAEHERRRESNNTTNTTSNVSSGNLFVNDSDSDDEMANFHFTADLEGLHNDDGLGMDVRVSGGINTNITGVPEFMRFEENRQLYRQQAHAGVEDIQQDKGSQASTSNISSNKAPRSRKTAAQYDSDDDSDDDEPRFRFRS